MLIRPIILNGSSKCAAKSSDKDTSGRILTSGRPWNLNNDTRAGAGAALDAAFAADLGCALPHVAQAVGGRIFHDVLKPATVVLDNHPQCFRAGVHPQPDFGGAGMFDDVLQGFLDDEEQVM